MGRLVAQGFAGGEAGAVALGEALELPDDPRGAEVVGVPQRAATERRKPEAEDGPDVAVAGRANDALRHRPGRFVQHHEDEPLDDLRRARAAVGMHADQLVHGRVHRGLLATGVLVESLSLLAPHQDYIPQRDYG